MWSTLRYSNLTYRSTDTSWNPVGKSDPQRSNKMMNQTGIRETYFVTWDSNRNMRKMWWQINVGKLIESTCNKAFKNIAFSVGKEEVCETG